VRLLARRLPGLELEFLDGHPRIIEHHLARQIRERGRTLRRGGRGECETKPDRRNEKPARFMGIISFILFLPRADTPYFARRPESTDGWPPARHGPSLSCSAPKEKK